VVIGPRLPGRQHGKCGHERCAVNPSARLELRRPTSPRPSRRNLLLKKNNCIKRVLDYAIGLPLFLASVPLVAVLALWIKRVSPGPAFYTQERQG
jgi:lipopolysaccharide/colanic/teichoic acid biosynthesis glycosyltransferase